MNDPSFKECIISTPLLVAFLLCTNMIGDNQGGCISCNSIIFWQMFEVV